MTFPHTRHNETGLRILQLLIKNQNIEYSKRRNKSTLRKGTNANKTSPSTMP